MAALLIAFPPILIRGDYNLRGDWIWVQQFTSIFASLELLVDDVDARGSIRRDAKPLSEVDKLSCFFCVHLNPLFRIKLRARVSKSTTSLINFPSLVRGPNGLPWN